MLLPTALAAGKAKVCVLSDKTYLHQGRDYFLRLPHLIPSFMPQVRDCTTKNITKPSSVLDFVRADDVILTSDENYQYCQSVEMLPN